MTAAAVACLLLSSPLTIFSMESSSLGLLAAAAAVGDEGEVDDLFGEDERGGDDGAALEATLSNADPPDVPIDAEVGDKRGENLCRSLSAARGDGVVPAPYAEARSGFCGVQKMLIWQYRDGLKSGPVLLSSSQTEHSHHFLAHFRMYLM